MRASRRRGARARSASFADRQATPSTFSGTGLFAVDHDGQNLRELATDRRTYRIVRMLSLRDDGSDDVLIVAQDIRVPSQWKRRYPDAFRLNTRSGEASLLTEDRPGDPIHWVADRAGAVRAAVTTQRAASNAAWWRRSADAPWQKLAEYRFDQPGIVPVAFDGDGTLIVASSIGHASAALYRYDTERMALGERLAEHPYAPLSQVVYDARERKVVGVRYDDGKPGHAWFDDEWAKLAAGIDKALPGAANTLYGSGTRMLVHSASDVDPGSWYLLDTQGRKLEFLLASRPELRSSELPSRTFVRYPARDGLSIPAYLTLPRGREAKDLPLVVLVHGGPFVRGAYWTFDAEAAFLASRGYAVLQPEFRGSAGFGGRHFRAGWKQWGRAMQDDLLDGVDWLVARGTVDTKRVCIMGASYGGYAAMMGLARHGDRYRCGISIAGVSDIRLMFTAAWSDTAYSDFMNQGPAHAMIGDPERDADDMQANSPLGNVSRIRAPVLLAHGGSDVRVPVDHGVRLRNALRSQGTPVEWLEFPDEGHGFRLDANRFALYESVAGFLARHLPAE